MRAFRKIIASLTAAALLITLPGLPCYEAAAQMVSQGASAASLGAVPGGGTVGAVGATPAGLGGAAGLAAVPGLGFGLSLVPALPSVAVSPSVRQAQPGPGGVQALQPAARTAAHPAAQAVSPAALVASPAARLSVQPARAAVPAAASPAKEAVLPAAKAPGLEVQGRRFLAAQASVSTVRSAQAVAAMAMPSLSAQGPFADARQASAKLFDNGRAGAAGIEAPVRADALSSPASPGLRPATALVSAQEAVAAPAPAAPAARAASTGSSIAGRLGSLGRRLVDWMKAMDLSRDEGDEAEPAPAVPASSLVRLLQKTLASAMGMGMGAGFLLSGAALGSAAQVWSPVLAFATGTAALAALGWAAWKRFGPSGPDARKRSKLALLSAGTGLLLLGAVLAPGIAGLVGASTLRLAPVGLLIGLALLFEFLNGMHDAANSIATVVATKTLSPRMAIAYAAFFNSIAYFMFGAHIATTIGSGLVNPAVMSNALLAAALLGASAWNWLTVRLGIPVSSSHSLIGGMVGAAVVAGGFGALVPATLLKTAAFMVLSPVIGLAAAFVLMAAIHHFFPGQLSPGADRAFKGAQLLSSALLSLGHGGNDSQKTIGIITALLFANGLLGAHFYVPWPVAVTAYAAMGLGTLAGGSRIIKTLGEKVTSLDRSMGTAAEVGAGASILLSTWLGVPVSTTHVVTGAVTGVGAAHGGTASVKWGTLHKIAWAWVLTIPFAALVSGLLYLLLSFLL